ncbi:unnamed protein product [Effrenium voratum]|uniref:DUF4864 domain-containing protein n=1 Tax=Effrenium voratum TaxID=2562239 RepID=A0AA36NFA0_9DINO|nr:unnamed protein product [Effrenium voratum]
MSRLAPLVKVGLLTLLLRLGLRTALISDSWRSAMPQPATVRNAVDVVLLQLTALQQNNPETNDGIAKTFEFASRGNKAVTGPLPRFAHMIHAGYPELLNSQSFTVLSALQVGEAEYVVRVEIRTNQWTGNRQSVFLWQLSDSGDGAGWMTDAVMPDEPNEAAER